MNGDARIHLARQRRPWWLLGLFVQRETVTVVLPQSAGAQFDEVMGLADRFEQEGYEVKVDFT